jgi:hypothetical protein
MSIYQARSDFSAPSWIKVLDEETPFDIIVSGFAIHHQPDSRKKRCIRKFMIFLSKTVFSSLQYSFQKGTSTRYVWYIIKYSEEKEYKANGYSKKGTRIGRYGGCDYSNEKNYS